MLMDNTHLTHANHFRPVMDGFTATTKIRELEKKRAWARSKIFAVTGVTSARDRQDAFNAGVDEFLTKPISMKDIKEILNRKNGADGEA